MTFLLLSMRILQIFPFFLLTFALNAASLGVKAGPNIVKKFYSSDSEDNVLSLNITGGFFGSFAVSEKIYFQPEILYTQKGNIQQKPGLEISNRLDYIDLFFRFGYKIPIADFTQVYFGPNIGNNIKATKTTTQNGVTTTENISKFVSGTMMQFSFGIDILIMETISFDIRYNWSLPGVIKNQETSIDSISLMAGYQYNFK